MIAEEWQTVQVSDRVAVTKLVSSRSPMKVALYARVSKPLRRRRGSPPEQIQNPENQLIRLRQYAQDRGWEVFGEYVDRSSGTDANRPALNRMISDAMRHRFKLVLTLKVDRIARSTINLYNIVSKLDERGIEFECADQDISTHSSTGKLLLAILGGVAEFERDLISERTRAGLDRVRSLGVRLGRPCKLVDDRRIRRLREKGQSLRQIASRLGISHQTVSNRLKNLSPLVLRAQPVNPRCKESSDCLTGGPRA